MQAPLILTEPASDRHISRAIALQILLMSIKNILVQAFPNLLEQNDVLNAVLFGAVAILYIHAFVMLGERMLYVGKAWLGIMAFVLIVWVLSFMGYPQSAPEMLELLPRFLSFSILTGFMLTKLTSLKWLRHYMMLFAYGITLTALIATVYILSVGHQAYSDWSTYSMPLSVYTLTATMWHYHQFFSTKRLLPLGFAALGTVIIVLIGSRNPLLAILAYVLVSILRYLFDRKQTFFIRLLALGCCSVAAVLLLFWRRAVSLVYELLRIVGIHSRTLYLLMQEEISSSGRDTLQMQLIEYMNQNPLLPLGVAGDRIPLDGEYAHSLYLSILATFGYAAGALVLILLVVLFVKALRRSQGHAREMLILYMCIVLPRSFVAVDVWQNDVFWWMLAIAVTVLDPVRAPRPHSIEEDGAVAAPEAQRVQNENS